MYSIPASCITTDSGLQEGFRPGRSGIGSTCARAREFMEWRCGARRSYYATLTSTRPTPAEALINDNVDGITHGAPPGRSRYSWQRQQSSHRRATRQHPWNISYRESFCLCAHLRRRESHETYASRQVRVVQGDLHSMRQAYLGK